MSAEWSDVERRRAARKRLERSGCSNLIRRDLTPAQRAKLIAKRKAAYEAVHPETKHGATGRGRKSSQVEKSIRPRDPRSSAIQLALRRWIVPFASKALFASRAIRASARPTAG
jgi:hypothetical protein